MRIHVYVCMCKQCMYVRIYIYTYAYDADEATSCRLFEDCFVAAQAHCPRKGSQEKEKQDAPELSGLLNGSSKLFGRKI